FIAALAVQVGIELVGRVGVRRANDVSYAVRDGHLRHLNRSFQAVRPVIQTGENVTMDIYHVLAMHWKDTGIEPLRQSIRTSNLRFYHVVAGLQHDVSKGESKASLEQN